MMNNNIDFSKITPAQQRRMIELMSKDIDSVIAGHRRVMESGAIMPPMPKIPMPQIGIPVSSVDDIIDHIEHEQKRREQIADRIRHEQIDKIFDSEQLFRFAYVPFVIAELAWDYADTVIIMARALDVPALRRLSRTIRNARDEYNRLRHRYIDEHNREREIENGYVFEEATKHITAQMMTNVRIDINAEYPDLNDDSRDLLLAVYQCHITSRALIKYVDRQKRQIEKRIGHPIGQMLPPSYYVMDKLIPEYIGDKPASAHFKSLMQQYIDTFATQIGLAEMNDTPPENDIQS